MNTNLSLRKIETLPDHIKMEVNDFIDFILEKEKRKLQENTPKDIMKFAGIWSDEEANEISQIIKEDCDNIDDDGWK
jgi:tetraacyldisaccharide-1-P 4'-kinase